MILQNILIHEFCRKVVDIFNSVVITTEFPPHSSILYSTGENTCDTESEIQTK